MKVQDPTELKWVGVDLHVHTPASVDYRGSRDASEYLEIVRRANEFETSAETSKIPVSKKRGLNPIGCVAFTDHNSVEGFRKFRELLEETEKLSKALRTRDPANPLIPRLEKDLETLKSVRVLMGVEIKADPGIHLLVIFAESVEPDQIVPFLEQAYHSKYSDFAGDPKAAACWTLKETLDKTGETFRDQALVVFPHIDSSGGVYEDLKEFPQARMAALTHPLVRALSFNKEETRNKLTDLFRQPDYRRANPAALIQSSDFHGVEGSAIGQPRTEVRVPEGKSTYKNIREAFGEPSRVKCSIDFVAEEYNKLTKGMFVARFVADSTGLRFRETDYESIAEAACGMLNSEGGVLEFEGIVSPGTGGENSWSSVRDQLAQILSGRLEPSPPAFLFRSYRLSPGKIRILSRVSRSQRLHSVNGGVLVVDGARVRPATAGEIESIVSENLNYRFGARFEGTLRRVSNQSTLLSKLPQGIPLLLSCHKRIHLGFPDSVEIVEINPPADKDGEAGELVDELIEKEFNDFPFGNPDGNTTLLTSGEPPRLSDQYVRFTVRRAEINENLVRKCAWGTIDHRALVAFFKGSVGLAEPGYIISDKPALLMRVKGEWENDLPCLLSWMKSSFFVWYCAVHLGNVSPFFELQFRPYRFPIPSGEAPRLIECIKERAQRIISDEIEFMREINRLKKKGTLDNEYREKVRQRHNVQVGKLCLAIDKEIYEFLGLPPKHARFIAETLREINLTDFGFVEELGAEE